MINKILKVTIVVSIIVLANLAFVEMDRQYQENQEQNASVEEQLLKDFPPGGTCWLGDFVVVLTYDYSNDYQKVKVYFHNGNSDFVFRLLLKDCKK